MGDGRVHEPSLGGRNGALRSACRAWERQIPLDGPESAAQQRAESGAPLARRVVYVWRFNSARVERHGDALRIHQGLPGQTHFQLLQENEGFCRASSGRPGQRTRFIDRARSRTRRARGECVLCPAQHPDLCFRSTVTHLSGF